MKIFHFLKRFESFLRLYVCLLLEGHLSINYYHIRCCVCYLKQICRWLFTAICISDVDTGLSNVVF